MPAPTGRCPNSDCRVEITGSRDVDSFIVTSLTSEHVYAIVCKSCGVIIGTAQKPR